MTFIKGPVKSVSGAPDADPIRSNSLGRSASGAGTGSVARFFVMGIDPSESIRNSRAGAGSVAGFPVMGIDPSESGRNSPTGRSKSAEHARNDPTTAATNNVKRNPFI
jgi:hypothetical protein